jgi:hypothetical protein
MKDKLSRTIVKVLRDHAMRSSGESFTVPGLGKFSFKKYEQIRPPMNLRTGKVVDRKYMPFVVVRALLFKPEPQLLNSLNEAGLVVKFTPVDDLNSKTLMTPII